MIPFHHLYIHEGCRFFQKGSEASWGSFSFIDLLLPASQ